MDAMAIKGVGGSAPGQPESSLADMAYESIRGRIMRCELVPGDRISERKIAAEINLGLAPVRAALARLATRGVLESIPRVGYMVRAFNLKYINDFFQAWQMLAPEIARQAVAKMGESEAAGLRRAMRQSEMDARHLAPEGAWVARSEALFDGLVAILDNEVIDGFYVDMQFDMHRLFVLTLRADTSLEGRVYEDDMEWAFSGDPEVAAAAVKAFVYESHRDVLTRLVAGGVVNDAQIDFGDRRSLKNA